MSVTDALAERGDFMSLISNVITVGALGGGAYWAHDSRSDAQADKQGRFDRATEHERDIHDMERPSDFTRDVGLLRTGTAGLAGVALAGGGVLDAMMNDWTNGGMKWSSGNKLAIAAGAAVLAGTGVSILLNQLEN